MGIEGGVGVAVIVLAVVDLDVVAVAPVVGGGGNDAVRHRVDGRVSGGREVGAAVAACAEHAGNILVGGQCRAKVQRAFDGGVTVFAHLLVQISVQRGGGGVQLFAGLGGFHLQGSLLRLTSQLFQQEQQGQETKKLQAELSRQSGRIESLEADAAKHLLDVKVLEANSSRQAQRIQFLEAEVERHLQTIKTLEEACATERLAKAALEAQVVQLTAAKEQKLSGEPVEAQAEEVVEKKTEVLPEEKVETTVRQLVEPKDKPTADSLKSLLDELSPDRMLLKAPAGLAN